MNCNLVFHQFLKLIYFTRSDIMLIQHRSCSIHFVVTSILFFAFTLSIYWYYGILRQDHFVCLNQLVFGELLKKISAITTLWSNNICRSLSRFFLISYRFLVPCEFETERLILLYYPYILSFAEEIFIRIFPALVLCIKGSTSIS